MGPSSEDDDWESVEPVQKPSKAPSLPGGPPPRAADPANPAHRRRVTGERLRRRLDFSTWCCHMLFVVPPGMCLAWADAKQRPHRCPTLQRLNARMRAAAAAAAAAARWARSARCQPALPASQSMHRHQRWAASPASGWRD